MSSNCDFLFLFEGELSFLLTSLKEILEKKDIKVEKCNFKLNILSNSEMIPKIFLIDAEVLNNNMESRVYLFDYCIENNLKIVVIGDADEVENALSNASAKIIAGGFKRPLNNQNVADKLHSILDIANFEGQKKKVLVVDDSPVFLRTVSEWLESDYAVSVCPSATAAFHMIEVKRPDLILLDYEMPICSGAQFLEMLQSEDASANIPVIFLTSRSDKETVEKVIALKPKGYLLKNLPKEDILNAISNFFMREKGM